MQNIETKISTETGNELAVAMAEIQKQIEALTARLSELLAQLEKLSTQGQQHQELIGYAKEIINKTASIKVESGLVTIGFNNGRPTIELIDEQMLLFTSEVYPRMIELSTTISKLENIQHQLNNLSSRISAPLEHAARLLPTPPDKESI